jgi:DNA-binding GntR family transcriptional regulator
MIPNPIFSFEYNRAFHKALLRTAANEVMVKRANSTNRNTSPIRNAMLSQINLLKSAVIRSMRQTNRQPSSHLQASVTIYDCC